MKKIPIKNTSLERILKPDLKMKLTYFFLFLGLFQINANVYSQDAKVTMEIHGESLKKVFNAIENQTEYHFFYSIDEIDIMRKITISANQEKVSEILTRIFRGKGIAFNPHCSYVLAKTCKSGGSFFLNSDLGTTDFRFVKG